MGLAMTYMEFFIDCITLKCIIWGDNLMAFRGRISLPIHLNQEGCMRSLR